MRRMSWLAALIGACLVSTVGGCGSSSKDSSQSDKPRVAKKDTKRKMTTGPAGKSLAAADDGRVVITMPDGWKDSMPANPKEGLLAQMKRDDPFPFPTIYVRVAAVKDFKTITSENLEEFADARRDKLLDALRKKAKSGANVRLYGDVQQVKAKSFRGIEYLKKGKTGGAKNASLELGYIETVVEGRMYTVELHALELDLDKYRPAALAVAANLKFPKAKIEPAEGAGAEE